MKRYDQLRKTSEIPKEEHKEMSRKGGIKSGEQRRKKRLLKDVLVEIMNNPVPESQKSLLSALKDFGVKEDEATFVSCICLQLLNLSMGSKVETQYKLKSIELIYKIIEGGKMDITSNGKDIKGMPLTIEVIEKKEQVADNGEDSDNEDFHRD